MSVNKAHSKTKILLVLLGISGLAFALLLVFVYMWFHSMSDIDSVRKRAVEDGIPVTWEELLPGKTDVQAMEAWQELVTYTEKNLVIFDYYIEKEMVDVPDSIILYGYSTAEPIRPGIEMPTIMKEYYSRPDQMECVNGIKRIASKMLPRPPYLSGVDRESEKYKFYVTCLNEVTLYLSEYSLSGSKERYNETIHLGLDLVESVPDGSFIDTLVKCAVYGLLLDVSCQRFEDLDMSVVDRLEALSRSLNDNYRLSLSFNFVDALGHAEEFIKTKSLFAGEESWYINVNNQIKFRMVRAWVYDKYLQESILSRTDGVTIRDIYDVARGWDKDINEHWWLEQADYFLLTDSAIESLWHAQMHAMLIMAEKKGLPWPVDMHSVKKEKMKPVVRDGRIIGAYTIGSDGVDDGPEGEQIYWLYGYQEY